MDGSPLRRMLSDVATADAAWLRGVLADERPEAWKAVIERCPDITSWESLPWSVVGPALAGLGTDDDDLAGWKLSCDLLEALEHPVEVMAEAVQATRRAILGLSEHARETSDPVTGASARVVADALAYSFSTMDVMDGDLITLRGSVVGWLARLRDVPDHEVGAAGPPR